VTQQKRSGRIRGFFAGLHYYFCVVWYFAGMLALLFLATMIGPLWVVAAALLITGWLELRKTRKWRRLFQRNWAVHPDVSDISPNLGKIMAELYERSGIDPKKYPLYDFRLCEKDRLEEEQEEDGSDIKKAANMLQGMSETYRASVLYSGRPILAVSAPMLALLDDEEERAVLAHELVHLREKHVYMGYMLRLLCSFVIWVATLARIVWFFAAGWEAAAYAVMAGISAGLIITRIIKAGKPEQLSDRWGQLKTFIFYTVLVSVLTMAVFTPVYPLVYLATVLIVMAASTILRGLSRTSEYRADAGIADLGANPLAMMTALRRLQYLQDEAVRKAFLTKRLEAKNFRNWAGKNLYATHPQLDDRLTRLEKIAKRLGYAQDEIRTAKSGHIEVDESHSYPSWMIRYMQAQ